MKHAESGAFTAIGLMLVGCAGPASSAALPANPPALAPEPCCTTYSSEKHLEPYKTLDRFETARSAQWLGGAPSEPTHGYWDMVLVTSACRMFLIAVCSTGERFAREKAVSAARARGLKVAPADEPDTMGVAVDPSCELGDVAYERW